MDLDDFVYAAVMIGMLVIMPIIGIICGTIAVIYGQTCP